MACLIGGAYPVLTLTTRPLQDELDERFRRDIDADAVACGFLEVAFQTALSQIALSCSCHLIAHVPL